MSATSSHLRLEGYFLKELEFSINDEMEQFPEDTGNLKPLDLEVIDITRLLDEETGRWRCELLVKSTDERAYDFKIVMIGFFSINTELGPDLSKLIAESNCPAVLYSAAREIVATITRRSPYPGTVLPLVTFVKQPDKPSSSSAGAPDIKKKAVRKRKSAPK